MIEVQVERLRAALRARDLSVNQLAKLLNEKQQTMQYVASGRATTRRCRLRRAEAIAAALGVPLAWLSDSMHELPGLLRVGASASALGQEERRRELAFLVSDFVERCVATFERDLRRKRKTEAGYLRLREQSIGPFIWAVHTLLNAQTWWRTIYTKDTADGWRSWSDTDGAPIDHPALVDEAQITIVRALYLLLTPWFEGFAQLRHEKVIEWAQSGGTVQGGIHWFTPRLDLFV